MTLVNLLVLLDTLPEAEVLNVKPYKGVVTYYQGARDTWGFIKMNTYSYFNNPINGLCTYFTLLDLYYLEV